MLGALLEVLSALGGIVILVVWCTVMFYACQVAKLLFYYICFHVYKHNGGTKKFGEYLDKAIEITTNK